MKYENTKNTIGNMQLWEDWPGIDDHEIRALLMVENNKLDTEEYIQSLIARHTRKEEQ